MGEGLGRGTGKLLTVNFTNDVNALLPIMRKRMVGNKKYNGLESGRYGLRSLP